MQRLYSALRTAKYTLRACDIMAEWSKALDLGSSLRAWVRIPLMSLLFPFLGYIRSSQHLF
jgi:hypothetical protein